MSPSQFWRIGLSALVAVSVGLIVVVVLRLGATGYVLRVFADWIIALAIATAFVGLVLTVSSRLAGGPRPASEAEFEQIVRRSERLAREGVAAEPGEGEFLELDPLDDHDFEELVRDALDDLPDLLRNALEHVAIVISDQGRRHGAYGLYQGDGAVRDDVPDRVVIFRDTLRRDFGHDAELLQEQVLRTVRHELAHHVGFDEMGVKGLGL